MEMSGNKKNTKKYFWLKLKTDFFNQREVKKLRKIAGGDTFTIIYLKMQLLSIKDEGKFYFEGTENNIAEQLSLELDEEIENVKLTLAFLSANDLIESISCDEYLLTKVPECIGTETDSAERVRRHRDRKKHLKALQCNTNVTKSNTEIEIEIEIEKELEKEREGKKENAPALKLLFGEFKNVKLFQEDLNALEKEYGSKKTKEYITKLDLYIAEKGDKSKSHYATIKKWIKEDLGKEKKLEPFAGSAKNRDLNIFAQ